MSNKEFQLYYADLKVRAQEAKETKQTLTPIEKTILVAKFELDGLRVRREAAKAFVRTIGDTAIKLVWPDDFVNLTSIEGVIYDETLQKDKVVTFTSYMTTALHMRATCLLYGPAGVGKTPLLEAAAVRLAMSYQDRCQLPPFIFLFFCRRP